MLRIIAILLSLSATAGIADTINCWTTELPNQQHLSLSLQGENISVSVGSSFLGEKDPATAVSGSAEMSPLKLDVRFEIDGLLMNIYGSGGRFTLAIAELGNDVINGVHAAAVCE